MNKKVVVYGVGAVLYAVIVVLLGRMGGALGLVNQVGLWFGFFALLRYRCVISDWLLQSTYPTILVYLVSTLPLMLFEENINCLPSGCSLIPVTIPFLILFLIVVYAVVKVIKVKSLWYIIVPACSIGLIWELTLGVSGSEFRALPVTQFVYRALWTWMSYAFFTIVPVQYLLRRQNQEPV